MRAVHGSCDVLRASRLSSMGSLLTCFTEFLVIIRTEAMNSFRRVLVISPGRANRAMPRVCSSILSCTHLCFGNAVFHFCLNTGKLTLSLVPSGSIFCNFNDMYIESVESDFFSL